MTPEERKDVENVIKDVLIREGIVDPEMRHRIDWVDHQMATEKIHAQRNEHIARHVLAWGIVGTIGAIMTAIGTLIYQWLKPGHAP